MRSSISIHSSRALHAVTALIPAAALLLTGCGTTSPFAGSSAPEPEWDFVRLFDGQTLTGWQLRGQKGDGYGVTNGVLYCAEKGGGNLLTEREYDDFILRFEFKLRPGSNNGLAIRAPLADGSLAYDGMELQILDDTAEKYARLRPAQYHGSLYDVVPAKRGALKPVGEWNQQEVEARGRRIRVTLNGQVTLDADINAVTDPKVIQKHPGLFREKGHIGFLGHNDYLEFRNIRIKELPVARVVNRPARGFEPLFNGENLAGWQGVTTGIETDPASERSAEVAREIANVNMAAHWGVLEGMLVHDGKGAGIVSARSYAGVELELDYKLREGSAGGVLLRGVPKAQIIARDAPANTLRIGSGGLHDGTVLYQPPLAYGDHFTGDWNRMRVVLVENHAHVFVNGSLVVKNGTVKNIPVVGPPGLEGGQGAVFYRSLHARPVGAVPEAAKQPVPGASAPAPKSPAAESDAPRRGFWRSLFGGGAEEPPADPAPAPPGTNATPAGVTGEMKLKPKP